MDSELRSDEFVDPGIDLAGPGETPPTTRQKACDAAVGVELHPPSTHSRAVYPQDACRFGQR